MTGPDPALKDPPDADDPASRLRRAGALIYSADGGPRRALELVDGVLADPDTTPRVRDAAGSLRDVLLLMNAVPDHLLRAGLPTDESGTPVPPASLLEALPELMARFGAVVPDGGDSAANLSETVLGQVLDAADRLTRRATADNLPDDVRGSMNGLAAAAALLVDLRGSEGRLDPKMLQPLTDAASQLADPTAAELLRRLQLWLDADEAVTAGVADPGDAVQTLREALEQAPQDDVLRPVLQRTLAMLRIRQAETQGDPDAVAEASDLFARALADMGPGHVLVGETRHQAAACLLVLAALGQDPGMRDRAEELVDRIRSEPAPDDSLEEGRRAVLESMVFMLRSRTDGRPEASADLNEALDALETAMRSLPREHPLMVVAFTLLAALLNDRHLSGGLLEDRRAAQFWFRRGADIAAAVSDSDPTVVSLLEAMASAGALSEAGDRQDRTAQAAALDRIESCLKEALPPHHLMTARLKMLAGVGRVDLGLQTGDRPALDRGIALLTELQDVPPMDPTMRAAAQMADVMVKMLGGLSDTDTALLSGAVEALTDTEEAEGPDERIARWAILGFAHLARQDAAPTPEGSSKAVEAFAAARDLMTDQPSHPMLASVLDGLATAYRLASPTSALGRQAASQALEAAAGEVLLQTDLADALLSACGAAKRAQDLARWNLTDGTVDEALDAVEQGRGLVLHAATAVSGVATRLRAAGFPGLAEEWDRELTDAAERHWSPVPPNGTLADLVGDSLGRRVPRDVRNRALQAMRRSDEGARLWHPPSTAEVRQALSDVAADALVYLLPATSDGTGWMIIREVEGPARAVPIADLRLDHPALSRYLRASRRVGAAEKEREVWDHTLDAVSEWAWEAMSALIREAPTPRTGTVPRVVLVASGSLGCVPWHAASGMLPSGRRTVACRELQISYAASSRQLVDVAQRPSLPPGLNPVIVGDPNGSVPGRALPFAAYEAAILAGVVYPGATLLGCLPEADKGDANRGRAHHLLAAARSATVEAVLDHLPGADRLGATLLHFGCHAFNGESPEQSYLELAVRQNRTTKAADSNGEETPGLGENGQLTVRTIIEQARGRHRNDPGPLVVLSSCSSDVTITLEDEALTLATGFLAAGATSVVGSRWPVLDSDTPLMMFAFHFFLDDGAVSPAEALRSAQLWMLDPQRSELEGMPDALRGDMLDHNLTRTSVWAAFVHYGR